MDTGEELKIKQLVRSQKTSTVLPKEGTLVCVTENLGTPTEVVFHSQNHD